MQKNHDPTVGSREFRVLTAGKLIIHFAVKHFPHCVAKIADLSVINAKNTCGAAEIGDLCTINANATLCCNWPGLRDIIWFENSVKFAKLCTYAIA